VTECDPVLTTLRSGAPLAHRRFTNLPGAEHVVTIVNGRPGLRRVVVTVNGRRHVVRLRSGARRVLDVRKAMRAGNRNTITIRGTGAPGATADVTIADQAA
jgi:hypothetical protein